MTVERIAALFVGAVAICFGLMLLPYANALRRRLLASCEPPPVGEVKLTRNVPRGWRAHILPASFLTLGAALVLFALFDA